MLNSVLYKKIKLTDDVVRSFEVVQSFKYKQSVTKNLTWSYDGELLLTSNQNDSLTVYSLVKGNCLKTLHSKNCGVDVIRFLDNSNDVIVCSTKSNNTEHKQFLKFWDIKENKYLKSLPQIGNICELNGICVNVNKKLMLVSSDDGHVKLYYINSDTPLILYKSSFMRPVSTFDIEGIIFAASYGKKEIHFYDLLMYDSGEYNIINLKNNMGKDEFIVNLLFTPDNKSLIVSTNENNHFKINSLSGDYICSYNYPVHTEQKSFNKFHINSNLSEGIKNTFNSNKHFNGITDTNDNNLNYDFKDPTNDLFLPTITPDGQYIMCGWKDSCIHIWNANGNYVTSLHGHEGPPKNVNFNPKCSILASSCLNIALWQPAT